MAAFTTLALIGLAAAAGAGTGAAIAKGRGKAPPQSLAAPAPTTANTIAAPAAPPSTLEQMSGSIRAGQQAGARQRRRAIGGRRPLAPSRVGAPRPIVQPTTLIGGAY